MKSLTRREELKAIIAHNLRCLRYAQGWTQQQMAARLHVEKNTYGHWEKGHAMMPNDKIIALCELLGQTADALCRTKMKIQIAKEVRKRA